MAYLIGLRGSMPGIDTGLSLPPAAHALHDASDEQHYPLGKKFWDGDRCFKYSKAGGTLVQHRCVAMYDTQTLGWTVVPTASPAGGHIVYTTVGSGQGIAADGAVAENVLQGGYITIFRLDAGLDNTDYTFRIRTNTAVDSGGGAMTVTVDHAIPYPVTTSAYTEITGNPYEDVRMITSGQRAFLGQPQIAATTTYPYHWIQTWGPTWLNPEGTPGTGAAEQQLVFQNNGSVVIHNGANATTLQKQHAGFVFTRAVGGGQGTPLVFLQVSC